VEALLFIGITNTPRAYAWGSPGTISALVGATPSGALEAELWLGAHPGSPSRIVDPSRVGGAETLADFIAADPQTALGQRPAGQPRLPFLLKVLAAASPLSLQAHPTAAQAAAGFAREQAAGIPLDAPNRNYTDSDAKPEIIYALEDGFEALCGFRSIASLRELIIRLIELDAASPGSGGQTLQRWLERCSDEASLRAVFGWLISEGPGVRELIDRVVEIAGAHPGEFATVVRLAAAHPGDPGIVISLMLNQVTLRRGEVLFLPAGNIHAYLRGVGIELMNSSDNVLRGGLTEKHVDIDELLAVLDFTPGPPPYLGGTPAGESVTAFEPDGAGFQLLAITGNGAAEPEGPAIAFCERGEFRITGEVGSQSISAGESFFVTADEGRLTFAGAGSLFLASSARPAGVAPNGQPERRD
jgi:mannose-6-phosphate isomerase